MWRAILHWLGGIGIIVMAVAVLPMLQVAGFQLFRMESSDNSEKIVPRASQITGDIATASLIFTFLCIMSLWTAGMTFFEAVAHAFATVSTGGFSTSDASIGHFNSARIDIIITVFMFIAGIPFTLTYQAMRGKVGVLLRDTQVRFYFGSIVFLILFVW